MSIALCLGSARSVWADYDRAIALCAASDTIIVACNHAGIRFPGHIDAWVTLHPDLFNGWKQEREWLGRDGGYRCFVHEQIDGGEADVLPMTWRGSSGLYAAQAALGPLGCTGAILCGVPLQSADGHIHWGTWGDGERYHAGAIEARKSGANIRSMSGWTAEYFGRPDTLWIMNQ